MKLMTLLQSHDESFQRHFKRALLWGILAHLLAVVCSEGFHRPDEQLGIMRYVGLKLGRIDADLLSKLSWEYPAAIRNWMQPGTYIVLAKFLNAFGIENPFVLACFFRLLSSTFALLASALLTLMLAARIPAGRARNFFPYMAFLLWWLPFFHARTTAENFGASTWQLAMVFIFAWMPANAWSLARWRDLKQLNSDWQPPVWSSLLGGILLGLSFNLRTPLISVVPFLGLWALLARIRVSAFLLVFVGALIACGLTALSDYWGYGHWTFSTFNWFWWELKHDVSTQFGTDPWWAYITKIISRGIPPLSLILVGSFLWFWLLRPLHLISWATLSFFVAHSAMGHKEMRFMFPLSAFAPYIIACAMQACESSKRGQLLIAGRAWRVITVILVVINLGALIYSSSIPAYAGINLYKFLYRQEAAVSKLYTVGELRDPLYFYMKTPFTNEMADTPEKIAGALQAATASHQDVWFLTTRWQQQELLRPHPQCQAVFHSRATWLIGLMPTKMRDRSEILSLFRCR